NFYNHRCTSELVIKDLKHGLNIDAISKADFCPNAADLWLKSLAYNVLLHLKQHLPAPYHAFSVARLCRVLLRVPAVLVRHARRPPAATRGSPCLPGCPPPPRRTATPDCGLRTRGRRDCETSTSTCRWSTSSRSWQPADA